MESEQCPFCFGPVGEWKRWHKRVCQPEQRLELDVGLKDDL